jgi:hypothetical protein
MFQCCPESLQLRQPLAKQAHDSNDKLREPEISDKAVMKC